MTGRFLQQWPNWVSSEVMVTSDQYKNQNQFRLANFKPAPQQ
jgi:hypothetical protein